IGALLEESFQDSLEHLDSQVRVCRLTPVSQCRECSLVRFKQLLAVDIRGSEQTHDSHSQGSRKVARQAAESRPTAGPGRRLFAGHRYFTFSSPGEPSNSYFAGSA